MRGILLAATMMGALATVSAASAAQLSAEPDRYVFVSGADDDDVDIDSSDADHFTIFTAVGAINLDATASIRCTGGGTDTAECERPPDQLRVHLDAGDDDVSVDVQVAMALTIDGGPGADTLEGGDLRDTITGGAGQDEVFAADGDDVVLARDGEVDAVDCGDGADAVDADIVDVLTDCEEIALPPPPPPPSPPAVVRCLVPSVRGKTLAKARALLAVRHCRLGRVKRTYSPVVKKGLVVRQSRRPGLELGKGARVDLVVSRGRRR
jgi:hypothetical protein